MGEAYWKYSDLQQAAIPPLISVKRPRSEFDVPLNHEISGYYDDRVHRSVRDPIRDSDSTSVIYDRYMRNPQQPPPYSADLPRSYLGGEHIVEDPRFGVGRRPDYAIPPSDATNTLFVEGLPSECTRREVAHIFRPFVGFKEVRLVSKEARRPGGDPLLLCFVDFTTSAHASAARDALHGYKFDEDDKDSASLRMQYARPAGARPGFGRGKR